LIPTIYALHGVAVTPDVWIDVQRAAPELPFVAPDLLQLIERGDGTLARVLEGLVARAPAGPLLLVGSSWGAQLALELGEHLGDRVVGTLLVAPGPADPDHEFITRARGLVRVLEHWNDEVARSLPPLLLYRFGPRYAANVDRLLRMFSVAAMRSASMLAIADGFRSASETLPLQHGPVRVLVGADNRNPITGPGVYEGWRQVLGDDAVERVPAASEYIQLDRPDHVADAIRALLRDTGAR